MDTFSEKLKMLNGIFNTPVYNPSAKIYKGLYNNRTYLYSFVLINTLPIEKLESFIKKQIGYAKPN